MIAKRKPGRPQFEPTDLQRRQVMKLAAEGNSPEAIAAVIEISEPTLRKHFWLDIQRGRLIGQAKNGRRLIEAADNGNVTAMIWLDKTRFGIREPDSGPKKEILEAASRTAETGTQWSGLLQ